MQNYFRVRVVRHNHLGRSLAAIITVVVVAFGLLGCTESLEVKDAPPPPDPLGIDLVEVNPPDLIRQLDQFLEQYQPQVKIVSPTPDQVIEDTKLSLKLQVQGLPIFRDPQLGLGPHLHILVDNRSYPEIYDLDQPIVLDNLEPGTHTLRVLAAKPWHESFKNQGAFAQVTFHLFAKTPGHTPDPQKPLLTYHQPEGVYGAEPLLLDYYLTNAPLDLDSEQTSWRIRCTINGQSFVMDRWQSVYLQGFHRGRNWVQLEFLDSQGQPVDNVFNSTVRVVTYDPSQRDPLARLLRGEWRLGTAQRIVNPTYQEDASPAAAVPEIPTREPASPAAAVPEIPTPEPASPAAAVLEIPTPEPASPAAAVLEIPRSGDSLGSARVVSTTEIPEVFLDEPSPEPSLADVDPETPSPSPD